MLFERFARGHLRDAAADDGGDGGGGGGSTPFTTEQMAALNDAINGAVGRIERTSAKKLDELGTTLAALNERLSKEPELKVDDKDPATGKPRTADEIEAARLKAAEKKQQDELDKRLKQLEEKSQALDKREDESERNRIADKALAGLSFVSEQAAQDARSSALALIKRAEDGTYYAGEDGSPQDPVETIKTEIPNTRAYLLRRPESGGSGASDRNGRGKVFNIEDINGAKPEDLNAIAAEASRVLGSL